MPISNADSAVDEIEDCVPSGATIPPMCRRDPIEALEERLGYRFRDRGLLEIALSHSSWANEQGIGEHYERTEFLGDAVLGLLAARWLFSEHPDLAEGDLSRLKSHVVSEPVLAKWAARQGMGEALRLGVGEDRSGGRSKPSLLADAMEAVLGAAFLDGGLEAAAAIVEPLFAEAELADSSLATADAKTALQEFVQSRGRPVPEYRHVAEEGPDHRKRFFVECWVDGEKIGLGAGATKKQAERRAARSALQEILSADGVNS